MIQDSIAKDKERCRTCGGNLLQRQTQKKAAQLKKAYYYTAYYYCPRCRKIFLHDKFKIENSHDTPLFSLHTAIHEKFDVEIWTDGACINNGRENAKAAWAFVSGDIEKAGLVIGKQTNNTAEALAFYHALLWAAQKGYKKIKIYSDSQISIHNMRKNVEDIKQNREIFEKIFEVIVRHNLQVGFEKVAGHTGDVNNERADKLANQLAGIK